MHFRHMWPVVEVGSWTRYTDKAGETFLVPSEHFEASDGVEVEEVTEGYAGRLSAPGYMDCTEYDGVYATAREAAQALVDAYADDSDEEAAWYAWAEDFDPESHLGLSQPEDDEDEP